MASEVVAQANHDSIRDQVIVSPSRVLNPLANNGAGEERNRIGPDASPPSHMGEAGASMLGGWEPSIKSYPHFDKSIRPSDIAKLVTDPKRVASNTFYPFMRYTKAHQPFREKFAKSKKKERPIRYASRRDAYIFSYYRKLLATQYEIHLAENGISESVIAYRRLKTTNGRGKSNIEFAVDAFTEIGRLGNASVVTMDVQSFFESLSHELLYKKWCWLVAATALPPDHQAVYKAITRYAVVDRDAVYDRLGVTEREFVHGRFRSVYKKTFKEMSRQLCSNAEFREKICGSGGKHKSLVEINRANHGIPQGSPISDLLANIYLFDFDLAVHSYVAAVGGKYFRYSDDIILIIPGGDAVAEKARDFVRDEIKKHGKKLKIKDSKTSVVVFEPDGASQKFRCIEGSGKNGIEYLGFRYDGRRAHIRDSTLSGLYRKVSFGLRAHVKGLKKRYPGKDAIFLKTHFNEAEFMQNYGRVEDFKPASDYNEWTFWTYARRAISAFGPLGTPIAAQLANFRRIVRARIEPEIARALR
jgi:hypothetical protein